MDSETALVRKNVGRNILINNDTEMSSERLMRYLTLYTIRELKLKQGATTYLLNSLKYKLLTMPNGGKDEQQ